MNSYYQSTRALWVCALLVSALFQVAAAQRVVQVPPGFGTLNATISGDTTSTGARVDTNTVYVLQRGGTYRLNAELSNKFPLRIQAAESAGPRPIIQFGTIPGGPAFRMFGPQSHLTLKGIAITGKDEAGGLQREIFRIRVADNIRLVINDCHIDVGSQVAIRVDTKNNKLYLTKSIISNIGLPKDPNNGRGIDTRGSNQDSIVVENVTFYNITSRVLRTDNGANNYVKFNHNTFVNIGQFLVTFGPTRHAVFTNNMIINPMFFGFDPAVANSDSARRGITVDSVKTGGPQSVNIRNNNFYLNPSIVAVYPTNIKPVPIFNATAQAFINAAGMAGTNISEAINFTQAPPLPINIVSIFYTDPTNTPDWNNSAAPFDFAYSNSTASYTKSTAGQPLGALTWFGIDIISAVQERFVNRSPGVFRLLGHYPNPQASGFNAVTNIQFDLSAPAEIKVVIFNLLGREVFSMRPRRMSAGNAQIIQINTSSLVAGVYYYRIIAVTEKKPAQVVNARLTVLK